MSEAPRPRPEASPASVTSSCNESGQPYSRWLTIGLICVFASALAFSQPALAQDGSTKNPICKEDSDSLADMIEGFLQIISSLGLMGLLLVWQANSLAEMFTLNREQKQKLKRHKRGAMKSAATIFVVPPLIDAAAAAMNIPIIRCVDMVQY